MLLPMAHCASHPVDHEEQGAVVGHRPHSDVEPGDHAKPASPLHVVDECVARSVKQVAGNAALGEGQLVPVVPKKNPYCRGCTRCHR